MSQRVKKYLLFMFGDWSSVEKNNKVVNNVKDVMESLVSDDEFTFITGEHIIIMCIKSKLSFEEVNDMLQEFLSPLIPTFFVMPKPRKLGYRLDDNLESHLFGDGTVKGKVKLIDPRVAEELSKQLRSIVENKMLELKNDIIKEKTKPEVLHTMTIDNLLDKIIDGGVGSLTDEEREFLDKYNK